MNKYLTIFILAVITVTAFANSAFTSELDSKLSLGIRGGISAPTEVDDFKSAEIFSNYRYPWVSTALPGFLVYTKSSLSVGVMDQDGDSEVLTSFSQLIEITNENHDIAFDLGGGIALLGDDKIGNHDFGTVFQFNYNLGLTLINLYKDISLGYRWFHLSDGGIGDGQGLNRHTLELVYMF